MLINIVASTVVAWDALLLQLKEVKGRNPIMAVDEASKDFDVGEAFRYLMTLTSCQGDSKLVEEGKIDRELTHFIHITVHFEVNTSLFEHSILSRSPMHFVTMESRREGERIYLACGSLYDWYNLITIHSINRATTETRKLLNALLLHLEIAGLAPLFKHWRKVTRDDGTFTLESIN